MCDELPTPKNLPPGTGRGSRQPVGWTPRDRVCLPFNLSRLTVRFAPKTMGPMTFSFVDGSSRVAESAGFCSSSARRGRQAAGANQKSLLTARVSPNSGHPY